RERRRHRRVRTSTGGEGGNRRVGPVIAQVVDEDLVVAAKFREPLREQRRLPAYERLREGAREVQTFGPTGLGRERNDNVEATAAGGFHEAIEIERAHQLADEMRRLDNRRPIDLRAGIEIDDNPVREL